MRQHPEGFYIYTERGRELVKVPAAPGAEMREMVTAVNEGRPTFPDHNWGRATLECCIGMIESSRQHKEIDLEYQSPSPVKMPEPWNTPCWIARRPLKRAHASCGSGRNATWSRPSAASPARAIVRDDRLRAES